MTDAHGRRGGQRTQVGRRARPLVFSVTVAAALGASSMLVVPPALAQLPPATGVGSQSPVSPSPAAPRVALSGRFGDRALIVIEGRARTLAVGESIDGVRLLGWKDESAEVQVGSQRLMLRVGGAPVDLTRAATQAAAADEQTRIVLEADAGGHFFANGSINGRSTRFMIDTGATLVAMSQAEADRLGIAFRDGARGMANTANGEVPVHRVMIQTIRIGMVEVRMLEAVIMPAAMPQVLLGNNFLERFNLQREDRRMTLQRRP